MQMKSGCSRRMGMCNEFIADDLKGCVGELEKDADLEVEEIGSLGDVIECVFEDVCDDRVEWDDLGFGLLSWEPGVGNNCFSSLLISANSAAILRRSIIKPRSPARFSDAVPSRALSLL